MQSAESPKHEQEQPADNSAHEERLRSFVNATVNGKITVDERGAGKKLFSGIVRDISKRKNAEHQLKVEAARMQAVLNTVLDGLITIDERGVIQSFNPAAVRIFGYQPQEVIGKNVKMLMPEPYHSGHDDYLRNYLNTSEAKVIGIGREVSARRKDGSIFPMELGVSDMHVVGKRLFVGTVRDISKRKQAEQEIQCYLDALKRSNQELDDFAYIASHDLKEPLRGLSNNAIFLKEDVGDRLGEESMRRLGRMTYLCERMERLINDLLYFSRLGRQELAVQKTDLNEVIRDIETMMESTLHESNAAIVVPEKLPTIVCDRPRIAEAFRNLITNAVKYNDKPEKRVEIACRFNDGAYAFFVRDNGIGIPREFYQDVFRIFKRLNDEDDSVKGTGAGLTFVKKIIERHGGQIWIDSEVGKGTTFYFTIREPQEG
jgi:two-component system sensor kinase FixL